MGKLLKHEDAVVTAHERPSTSTLEEVESDKTAVAWVQVLCGFICMSNSWGMINAYGEWQNYYQTSLRSQTPSDIAWIGSIQAFLTFLGSVAAGRLLDSGYLKLVLTVGVSLHFVGLFATSFATQFYQIVLAQGVCTGIGCSCLFSAAVTVVAPYFTRMRATALGISTSGTSFGGVLYPIVLRVMIDQVGFGWAMRAMSLIMLFLNAIPLIAFKSKLSRCRTSRSWIDVESLRDVTFVTFSLSAMVAFFGVYIPMFYIQPFATSINSSKSLTLYILPILNAAGFVGRATPTMLADRIGTMNTYIPMLIFTAIAGFAWIAVTSKSIAAFTVFYGVLSGGVVSLIVAVVPTISDDMTKIGTRVGMCFAVCSIGVLLGTPAAGWLINRQNGKFEGAQILTGVAMVVSLGWCIVAKRFSRVATR